MKIGLFGFIDTLEGIDASLRTAAEQGFDSYWIPQAFGMDTLNVIGALGRDIPGIRFATAVVPTYPRHPMVLAQQALTTNLLVGGRLALGVGPSHKPVVEGSWGISFDRPIRHLREYLEALAEALGQRPRYEGETITAKGDLSVPGATPPPVLVSALGPQLLKLTGRVADGTITWMTGPNTLRELTIPTINEAASAAGRSAPEIVAGVPVCVTDDVEAHPRAGRPAASRCTAPCPRTGPCSIVRATKGRATWRSSATPTRSASASPRSATWA